MQSQESVNEKPLKSNGKLRRKTDLFYSGSFPTAQNLLIKTSRFNYYNPWSFY